MLIFVALRMLLNYQAANLDEVLVHQFFKEKIWSVKEGKFVKFYYSENSNQEKIQQYIIEPYLTSRRIKDFSVTIVPAKIAMISSPSQKFEGAKK